MEQFKACVDVRNFNLIARVADAEAIMMSGIDIEIFLSISLSLSLAMSRGGNSIMSIETRKLNCSN
jgi:hypothetical protein